MVVQYYVMCILPLHHGQLACSVESLTYKDRWCKLQIHVFVKNHMCAVIEERFTPMFRHAPLKGIHSKRFEYHNLNNEQLWFYMRLYIFNTEKCLTVLQLTMKDHSVLFFMLSQTHSFRHWNRKFCLITITLEPL